MRKRIEMLKTIEHIINIDLVLGINMNRHINIRKNDANSNKFVINVYCNSLPCDLTGAIASIYFQKPDSSQIFRDCIVDDVLSGRINYSLESQVVNCAGIVSTRIIIYKNNRTILTSIAFNFLVNNINQVIKTTRGTEANISTKLDKGNIFVSVLDFGAKGDGITNDTAAIQSCINQAPSTGVIYFPSTGFFYNVTNLTIPVNKSNLKLMGSGKNHSYIKFSSKIAVSIMTEGINFNSLRLSGAGLTTSGSCMFKDERPVNIADFDFSIESCSVSECETVVQTRGRGVTIESSFFYRIRHQIIKADFPSLAEFVAGTEDTQTYNSGFRGFIFRNNRVHYSPCEILNNVGTNKMNLSGVLITGNQLEGSTTYIDGYVRNCEISSNIHYHIGNVREALIILHGCDNVNIELNVSGKRVSNEGIDSYSNKIMQCTGKYNNLTIKANIQDVYRDVFYFNAGGQNLDIQVNANNICIADASCYSLVKLDNKASVYEGVNVRGTINSPSSNFIAVKRNGNIVKNHNINLDITGEFLSYDNLDSCVASTRRVVNGMYSGDGTTNRQITVKYMPSIVQVFSNDFIGIKYIGDFKVAPNITINESGFTVTLTANKLNETYIYIVQ